MVIEVKGMNNTYSDSFSESDKYYSVSMNEQS